MKYDTHKKPKKVVKMTEKIVLNKEDGLKKSAKNFCTAKL